MTAVLAAITRVDVAQYIATLATVYAVFIFIRIIMSYFRSVPHNRALNAVLGFVRDVTDPYLNLFRRILPPVRLGPAALDLSPIIAVFVLFIVSWILQSLILA